jgi:hypothetical protein
MQDKLEKFVKEHRNEFDAAEPSQSLWGKIANDLGEEDPKVRPIGNNTIWWKVAVAVLLVAVSYLAIDKFLPREEPVKQLATLAEFREFEAFYTSVISEKTSKLSVELEGEEFFHYLEGDIAEIDEIYKELKNTFENEQGGEQVLNTLIHLLRQKLHLVNSQLDILEEARNPVKTLEEETVSSL